jgi:triosephosphate isomerase
MNKTPSEGMAFADEFAKIMEGASHDVDYAVAPTFVTLAKMAGNTDLPLAAQNVHFEDNGAFTGEVNTAMLEELNTKYVIIGHSERREMFNETDETVNKKVLKTLTTSMTPVVAYGETEAQFDAGETKDVVRKQLTAGLSNVENIENVVLAYEPI